MDMVKRYNAMVQHLRTVLVFSELAYKKLSFCSLMGGAWGGFIPPVLDMPGADLSAVHFSNRRKDYTWGLDSLL